MGNRLRHRNLNLLSVDDPREPGSGVGLAGGAVEVEPVPRVEVGREPPDLRRQLRQHGHPEGLGRGDGGEERAFAGDLALEVARRQQGGVPQGHPAVVRRRLLRKGEGMQRKVKFQALHFPFF